MRLGTGNDVHGHEKSWPLANDLRLSGETFADEEAGATESQKYRDGPVLITDLPNEY